ncbi:hypothetical protein [Haloarchaeobius sp. HME9146]|nr:hypothetical protein [Haloarchaeobius sp. HME9146]MCT9095672.1 hypothetical protein [Haloarchaeobius sp. HME9146]
MIENTDTEPTTRTVSEADANRSEPLWSRRVYQPVLVDDPTEVSH